MLDWLVAAAILIGTAFAFIASLGVVRLPDIYLRLQAATKAATVGVSSVVLGAALHFQNLGDSTQAVLVVAFLFLTAPIAAHVIARAAYATKTPLWESSHIDEMQEHERRDGV